MYCWPWSVLLWCITSRPEWVKIEKKVTWNSSNKLGHILLWHCDNIVLILKCFMFDVNVVSSPVRGWNSTNTISLLPVIVHPLPVQWVFKHNGQTVSISYIKFILFLIKRFVIIPCILAQCGIIYWVMKSHAWYRALTMLCTDFLARVLIAFTMATWGPSQYKDVVLPV